MFPFIRRILNHNLPILRRVGETKAVSAAYENSIPITAADIRTNSNLKHNEYHNYIPITVTDIRFSSNLKYNRHYNSKPHNRPQ